MTNRKPIIEYMERNSLTQAEFAKLCGISSAKLSRILEGKPITRWVTTCAAILKVINVSADELYFEKEE